MIYLPNGIDRQTSVSMYVGPGQSKAFQYEIDALDGYALSATTPNAGAVVWAKAEPGDAFQNIVTTPISLTGFGNTRKLFYFELRVNEDIVLPVDDNSLIPQIRVALA